MKDAELKIRNSDIHIMPQCVAFKLLISDIVFRVHTERVSQGLINTVHGCSLMIKSNFSISANAKK